MAIKKKAKKATKKKVYPSAKLPQVHSRISEPNRKFLDQVLKKTPALKTQAIINAFVGHFRKAGMEKALSVVGEGVTKA